MTSENENSGLPSLTAEEQAYFDNRGNVPEPKTEPEQAAAPDPEDADEPIDLIDEVDEEEELDPDAEPDEKPRKQVVPIKALHKEREERKALAAKLQTIEIERARMEERMNMMLQQMQAPQQKEAEQQRQDEMPGDDDPIAQIEWLKSQVITQKQQEQEQRKAQEQQQAIQRHVMEVDNVLTQAMTEDPTVKEAFDFGVQALRDHYAKQGVPPWELEPYIQRDMQNYALRAPKTKAELAEYAKANARYFGWSPQAQQPSPEAAKMDAKPSTKSLSQASGSAAGATMTAQDLLRMDPDQFQRFIDKNPKKYRQMLGG